VQAGFGLSFSGDGCKADIGGDAGAPRWLLSEMGQGRRARAEGKALPDVNVLEVDELLGGKTRGCQAATVGGGWPVRRGATLMRRLLGLSAFFS